MLPETIFPSSLALKSQKDFDKALRSSITGLWRGDIDLYMFVDGMYSSLNIYYRQAWAEGAASFGISPGDRTAEEENRLVYLIQDDLLFVFDFGAAIQQNGRASGGKLGTLEKRANIWSNRYNRVREIAKNMAGTNQKLKWLLGPRINHCPDCLNLSGRVYRASIWDKYDIYPGHPNLACGGFQCGCSREVTNDPVTPGHPPRLMG